MVELRGESKSSVMGSVNLKKKKGDPFITSKSYKLNVPSVPSSNNPIWSGSKCMKANQMSKEYAGGASCFVGTNV